MQLLEEHQNLERGARVQIAGGFVCQYYGRVVHQCASNGHALHLSAGHLIGLMLQTVAQAYGFERFDGPAAAFGGRYGRVVH